MRASSSETLKKLLPAGSLSRPTMTRSLKLRNQRTGSRKPRMSTLSLKALALTVSGETRTAYATGERSESRNIFLRLRDTKDSGKTQRRSAAYLGYTLFSMRKIPESSQKGSRRHIRLESMLTPLLDTITILKTCQLTKSQKLTMIK